ncbi:MULTISPECIES: hypothetical protein [unclassified Streptomyces]|uniref:hypothetical protein n=1 Tax=unclassified Streptomyces TaxID=2593676 RepID=UPI0033B38A75
MDSVQQHMYDSYRAVRHGEAPPPLPGTHDWAILRGIGRRVRAWAVAHRPPYA